MIRRQACPQTLVLCLAELSLYQRKPIRSESDPMLCLAELMIHLAELSLCQWKPNQSDLMALFADPMLRLAELMTCLAELSLCQRELSRPEPDPMLRLAAV